jgi:CheY-like chemotaxis protein
MPEGPSPVRPLVLVVDDQPDVRLALGFVLESYGFRVVAARDGIEALECVAKQAVDVVLTDLYMPGMDGLSLVRALRGTVSSPPRIIAMSGSPNLAKEAALTAARALGADVILPKPVSGEMLINTIHRLVGGGPTLLGPMLPGGITPRLPDSPPPA